MYRLYSNVKDKNGISYSEEILKLIAENNPNVCSYNEADKFLAIKDLIAFELLTNGIKSEVK